MPTARLLMGAAEAIGVSYCKLQYLRKKGLIPEAVKVGRIHLFPEELLPAIRQRLIASGHIKTAEVRETAHV